METTPKFCIVVPVNHTLEYLGYCLDSLEQLDYPADGFCVVTVDSGHVPGLATFVEARKRRSRMAWTHLALPPRPPSPLQWVQEYRMNEARNLAVARTPAAHYIFVEDDTSFHPDWLRKTERWIHERTGALGGPDFLPAGMSSMAVALDVLLSSPFGSPGRGPAAGGHRYCPRKDYLLIPAPVLASIGPFPETMLFGTEMDVTRRIRGGGWDVSYMEDNPIWHRRVTTLSRFVRRNVLIAREKVGLLREQGRFWSSPHALVLLAAAGAGVAAAMAFFVEAVAILWVAGLAAYALFALLLALRALLGRRDPGAALWMLILMPCHHVSVLAGILTGLAGGHPGSP